jgi:hypothetical protein
VLRDFYAVHSGLRDSIARLLAARDLRPWNDDDEPERVRVYDEDEVMWSDDLLDLFWYGDDRHDLFDLTGDADNPPVRSWGDGLLYPRDEQLLTFWAWFEGKTEVLLKRS